MWGGGRSDVRVQTKKVMDDVERWPIFFNSKNNGGKPDLWTTQQWPSPPLSMTNDDLWLLAVIIVNCLAAAMMVVDGGNSGRR